MVQKLFKNLQEMLWWHAGSSYVMVARYKVSPTAQPMDSLGDCVVSDVMCLCEDWELDGQWFSSEWKCSGMGQL